MMLTKGAIGNLINRYSAVLKKCSLMNTFGSLAVASMLVAGGVSGAQAADDPITTFTDFKSELSTNSVQGITLGADITAESTLRGDNLTIGRTLAIDGAGKTLTGTNASTMYEGFEVNTKGSLILKDMTLTAFGVAAKKETPAAYGAALKVAGGTLTVENVVFKDNRAEPGNSMGGAVALGHDGNITSASFKDSSFIGNRATGAGGAISFANTAATTAENQKILTLTNIDFKNNTSAGVGGAIRNYLGIVKFDITKDMTYSGNKAGLNSDGTFGKLYTDYG
jgi:predicted outer membrane repeat protein